MVAIFPIYYLYIYTHAVKSNPLNKNLAILLVTFFWGKKIRNDQPPRIFHGFSIQVTELRTVGETRRIQQKTISDWSLFLAAPKMPATIWQLKVYNGFDKDALLKCCWGSIPTYPYKSRLRKLDHPVSPVGVEHPVPRSLKGSKNHPFRKALGLGLGPKGGEALQ